MADLTDVIQAAVIRPGDKLVLRLGDTTTPAALDSARSLVEDKLPGVEVVFIGGNVEDMLVYRPEDGGDRG